MRDLTHSSNLSISSHPFFLLHFPKIKEEIFGLLFFFIYFPPFSYSFLLTHLSFKVEYLGHSIQTTHTHLGDYIFFFFFFSHLIPKREGGQMPLSWLEMLRIHIQTRILDKLTDIINYIQRECAVLPSPNQ